MKVFVEDVIVDGESRKVYIETDSMNYMVKVYSGEKNDKGAEIYVNKGNFISLANAINGVMKLKIHESTATTLLELQEDIKRIENDIKSRIGGY